MQAAEFTCFPKIKMYHNIVSHSPLLAYKRSIYPHPAPTASSKSTRPSPSPPLPLPPRWGRGCWAAPIEADNDALRLSPVRQPPFAVVPHPHPPLPVSTWGALEGMACSVQSNLRPAPYNQGRGGAHMGRRGSLGEFHSVPTAGSSILL